MRGTHSKGAWMVDMMDRSRGVIGGSGERRSGLGGMETVGAAGGTDDERGQEGGEHAEDKEDQVEEKKEELIERMEQSMQIHR